jgi:hypothetical protein
MKHFSEEYLEHLINEHRLVSVAIEKLSMPYSTYLKNNGHQILIAAIDNLAIQKAELEVKIDVISEFLHS